MSRLTGAGVPGTYSCGMLQRSFALPLSLLVCACAGGPQGTPGNSGGGGNPQSGSGDYFPAAAVWYQDVSRAPLDAESRAVTAYLDRVGWGLGRMQIDFSIEVLQAPAGTPLRAFTPTDDHFSPDCDTEPVPVPSGGALEGEEGYSCLGDGDCHLIVADRQRRRIFEMWRADIRGHDFRPGRGERPGLVPSGVAGEGPGSEPTFRVGQDRANQTAALRARGTDHGDDLLLRHCCSKL